MSIFSLIGVDRVSCYSLCAIALWLIFEGPAYMGRPHGEKDLGLGVLAALFVVPVFLSGTAGLGA